MRAEVIKLKNYALARIAELMPLAEISVSQSLIGDNRNSVYITMQYIRYNRFAGGSIRISDHGTGAFRYHHDKEVHVYSESDIDRFLDDVLCAYRNLEQATFGYVFIDKKGKTRSGFGVTEEEGGRLYVMTPEGNKVRVTKVMREMVK